jgi:iron complex outermembrane recepter protein
MRRSLASDLVTTRRSHTNQGQKMNQRHLNRRTPVFHMLFGSIMSFGALMGSTSALAQTDDSQVLVDDSQVLEEIIVTATKRAVGIQDLALSVTALQGQALEDSVILNFAAYAESVPGVAFTGNEPGNEKMIIRGVSTDSFNAQLQSTVGVYIDDMPGIDVASPTVVPDLHMFDVNRVEVLRGPQGTLWGSATMAGAIRIITNRPDVSESEFRARMTGASVDGGGTDFGLDAMANFPLVQDSLAFRITAYTRTDAGFLDALNLGINDSNETNVTGVRTSLRWLPSDKFTVDLTATYQNMEVDDGASVWLNNPLDPTQDQDLSAIENVRFNYTYDTRDQPLTISNLVLEYDFGSALLVSSSTVGDGKLHSTLDQTLNTSFPLLGVTGGTEFEASFVNDEKTDTFTEEFRLLVDNPDSALSWLIGAYYLDSERERMGNVGLVGSNAVDYPNPLLPGFNRFTTASVIERTEKALFGEVTWRITDRVEAVFGARTFDNEQRRVSGLIVLAPFAPGFPPLELPTTPSSVSASDTIYKFSLAFRPTDDVMLYALASEGFRLGGENGSAADFAPTIAPKTYGSDTLWNYELGARTSFNEGRTVLNATAFYVDWSDVQSVFRLDQPPLPPFPFTLNAGKATSKGIEVDLTTRLGENWIFHTAITALEAEIVDPGAIAGAQAQVEAGTKLPGTPDFQSSTSLEYSTGIAGRETTFSIDHRYVGESTFDLTTTATQGNYNIYGFIVRSALSDHVDLSLYARNLGNTYAVTGQFPASDFAPGQAATNYIVRPRTIGLNLQVGF